MANSPYLVAVSCCFASPSPAAPSVLPAASQMPRTVESLPAWHHDTLTWQVQDLGCYLPAGAAGQQSQVPDVGSLAVAYAADLQDGHTAAVMCAAAAVGRVQ